MIYRASHKKAALATDEPHAMPKWLLTGHKKANIALAVEPSDIAYLNFAALKQLRYGEIDRAALILNKAISICIRKLEGGSPTWWGLGLVEPRINLGRIAALRGDTAAALAIYKEVLMFSRCESALWVNGYAVDPFAVGESLALRSDCKPTGSPYIAGEMQFFHESIRALLCVGDGRGAASFLAEWLRDHQERSGIQRHLILETRVLVALGAQDVSGACDLIDRLEELDVQVEHKGLIGVLSQVLRAELLLSRGEHALAEKLLGKIVHNLISMSQIDNQTKLYLLFRISLAFAAMGVLAGQAPTLTAYSHYLESSEDEIIKLLYLVMIESCHDRHAMTTRLRDAVRQTSYRFEKALGLYELSLGKQVSRSECCPKELIHSTVLLGSVDSVTSFEARQLIQAAHPCVLSHDLSDMRDKILAQHRDELLEAQFTTVMQVVVA